MFRNEVDFKIELELIVKERISSWRKQTDKIIKELQEEDIAAGNPEASLFLNVFEFYPMRVFYFKKTEDTKNKERVLETIAEVLKQHGYEY